MNPHQQIVEKKHAKHFFFFSFSWRLNSPILCLCSSLLALSLFYISVWIVSTWASSCRFWICCVGWLIPVQTGGGWGEKKKKKKKKKSNQIFSEIVLTHIILPPISASFMSFKNNSSLTNEARLIQRHPGCTNWAQHPFYSLSFQEQCSWWNLLWAYLRALMNDWMLFFDGLLMPKWICLQFQNENLHYRGIKCQLPSLLLTHDLVVFSSRKIQTATRV